MINTYNPKMAVRIISRQLNELVLNNILAISTVTSTDGKTGFSISLDFRQGFTSTQQLIDLLEPKDYVEIYMVRKPDDHGNMLGFYSYEEYKTSEPTWSYTEPEGRDVFFYPLELPVMTDPLVRFDPETKDVILNGGFTPKLNEYGVASPLTIPERVLSSHSLVMCGQIMLVERRMSIEQSGTPRNTIVIHGAGLDSLLDNNMYLVQNSLASIDIFRTVLPQLADNNAEQVVKNLIDKFVINLDTSMVQIGWVDKAKKDQAISFAGRKARLTGTTFKTIDRVMYYGVISSGTLIEASLVNEPRDSDGNFGRIEQLRGDLKIFPTFPVTGPIRETLRIASNSAFTELWIDELGRVVFRPILSAYTQSIYKTIEGGNALYLEDGKPQVDTDKGILIDSLEEIIEVIDTKDGNQIFSHAIISPIPSIAVFTQQVGIFPMVDGYLGAILSAIKGSESEANADIAAQHKRALEQFNATSIIVGSMPLVRDESSKVRFWLRHQLRPYIVADFSATPKNLPARAVETFQNVVAPIRKLRVVARGDTRFRAGKKIYIKPLNIEGYVAAVSNDYQFGDIFSSTLDIVYARSFDEFSGIGDYKDIKEELIT